MRTAGYREWLLRREKAYSFDFIRMGNLLAGLREMGVEKSETLADS